MNDRSFESSASTPEVELNSLTGVLLFRGRCLPEDADAFFEPILSWIRQFCAGSKQSIQLCICLEYFNIGSSRKLMQLIRELEGAQERGFDVTVKWFYTEDDQDILEEGHEFAELSSLHFEFIETEFDF